MTSPLLDFDRVILLSDAEDRETVLREAAFLLASPGLDGEAVYEALRLRETMGSTALGQGVAVPHGRVDNLDARRACFIKLDKPVDFGGEQADLIFALLVPKTGQQGHLQLLAKIAEKLARDGFRDALRNANTKGLLYAALTSSQGFGE
ncbi:PTS sugar transporter subunit IIA [Lysobacter soyae]|uniref:PTS sugar transporter subunit IIA n=1 Tax=Lysobacter soyae TaxID=2764185 RepID=A0ABX8WQ18_9GAMM|nr:PTS sugar transporter subunit IIA [Lysobacter sp. CJ11]QYR52613.1 PTS sugar transporter subunit IIA [Lysobacter sp. CJ11]